MTPVKLLVLLTVLSQVSCTIPYQNYVGTAISATALALSIPHYFIFKSHLRILDFLQLIFLFSTMYTVPLFSTFSQNLSDSWLKFMPNFYSSLCDATGFTCNVGYSLSAGTVLLGIILLALFITGIEKCRKPDKIKFMPVFTLFKGFVRWVYISLVAVSSAYIYMYLTGLITGMFSNFIAPIIVGGICLIFPFAQLIAAKCSETPETEDFKSKWAEFLGVMRILIMAVLVTLQAYGINLIYIGSFITLVGYAVGYSLLFRFSNIPERVLVAVEESVLVCLYALYIFKLESVSALDLDFYMVCTIFLLQFIYEIYSWVVFIKLSKAQSAEVVPQDSKGGKSNNFLDDSMGDIIVNPSTKRETVQATELRRLDNAPARVANDSPLRKKR